MCKIYFLYEEIRITKRNLTCSTQQVLEQGFRITEEKCTTTVAQVKCFEARYDYAFHEFCRITKIASI